MKATILCAVLFFTAMLSAAQIPSDHADRDWKSEIPRVVYPDSTLVGLYEKTWEIASHRVRTGPKGIPASPYLDENCYDDQIWIWDSCFMVMFSKYAPKAFPGKETLSNLYVPILENKPTPLRIHLRDNPPLFAWIEYENYVFTGDRSHIISTLLENRYLQRFFDYFNTVPEGDRNPVVSPNPIFRRVVHDRQGEVIGYTWTGGASGMDNTPRGRDAGGYDKILWVDAVSQQALSALYISRLYEKLGRKAEAGVWKGRYDKLKKLINEKYWDEKDGFYYDVELSTGKPVRIKTPASFWPMLAEIPSKRQADRMVEYLKKETSMGGKYPWVSLSRDDKDYNDSTGDYWRGGIWLPMVYMGTKALEKYGYDSLADSLAKNVVMQQLRTYNAIIPNTIWECYNPRKDEPSTEHGRRARPDFCGWSALGPISLFIENILGFRQVDAVSKSVVWRLNVKNGTHGLKNLHFGDVVADIIYDADTHKIRVKATSPFTLVVNGKRYRASSGTTLFKAN